MSWPFDFISQNVVLRSPPDGSGGGYFSPNQTPVGPVSTGSGGTPLGKRGNSLTPPHDGGGKQVSSFTKNKEKQSNKDREIRRVLGRRDLVADQMRAASIYWHYANRAEPDEKLPAKGVTFCGWTQIKDVRTGLMRVESETGYRSFFEGIQTCGLRWVCPCCTASAAQHDRAYVNDGLAAARKAGLRPIMITLTTRHSKDETAADVLDGIIRAEQGLKGVKAWRRFCQRIGGYARVLEWTYGKHGHHPHFHIIVLVRAENEEEAIRAAMELKAAYMRQLVACGRDGTSEAAQGHSFHVQGAGAAGAYVAKWGSAEELTGALAKAGNGEGLTSWQLLRLARTARDLDEKQRYAAIWWEIICATKGRAQLYKSAGWRELVEKHRANKEEPAKPDPDLVHDFGTRTREPTPEWLQARPRRLSIREAAEAHEDINIASIAVAAAIKYGRTDAALVDADDGDDDDDDISLIDDEPDGDVSCPIRPSG